MKTHWISRLAALWYLGAFAVIGLLVAYIGFCDPDTCWHLALGKWMFHHRALPMVDPFSSNVFGAVHVDDRLPLMQHEWLSDLLLYAALAMVGLKGLLLFVSLLSSTALIVIPAFRLQRQQVPRVLIIGAVSMAVLASGFRLWVRPEVFSFFCFSLLIFMHALCLQTRQIRLTVITCACVFAIMIFWSNLHALFILGVAYCLCCLVLSFVRWLTLKDNEQMLRRSFSMFSCALLGTLVTPWNFHLWRYMFLLAGSPVTHANKENGPLNWSDLHSATFLPLVMLLSLNWALVFFFSRRKAIRELVQPFALAAGALAIAILFRRLTPFAALIALDSIASLFITGGAPVIEQSQLPIVSRLFLFDAPLARLGVPASRASACAGLLLSGLVCFLSSTYMVAPVVPSPSRLFSPPYEAVAFLNSHTVGGRFFNDSKYGSMMTWTMPKPPDIFIDGRFDSFERAVVTDYNLMRLCKPGWEAVLDRYKIATLFFPSDTPIINALKTRPGWHVLYSDRVATIIHRD